MLRAAFVTWPPRCGGQSYKRKTIKEGSVYNVGFAVHDDNITTRGHHVSFVRTLGFGAKADIEAVKLP